MGIRGGRPKDKEWGKDDLVKWGCSSSASAWIEMRVLTLPEESGAITRIPMPKLLLCLSRETITIRGMEVLIFGILVHRSWGQPGKWLENPI
jgi:hypothetical protein